MKKIAFTICAKNYIGLAQVLERSIKDHNDNIDFYIFVADEFLTLDDTNSLPNNVLVAKDVLNFSKDKWNELSFKYDLTEFCTCLKPTCFKYIFNQYNPDACIYFDPDILVFNTLDYIFEQLENYSIIVTPHITSIQEIYSGKLKEQGLFFTGMFNLGFLALKGDSTANKMLNWWEVRLEDRCFRNGLENYFTDQKWMDFLPTFYPTQLLISFHLGLNFAPWNFYEREIVNIDNSYFVKNRLEDDKNTIYPLIFVHYSGFNYQSLLSDQVSSANIAELEIFDDLNCLFNEYSNYLKDSNLSKFINLSYSYNYFLNETNISLVYRRLYRRMQEDGLIKSNPFDSKEKFYMLLNKSGLMRSNMINSDKSSIQNIANVERKTVLINKLFFIFYKIVGGDNFFQLVRLMRLYSKIENHVYIIEKGYFKKFNIRT